MSRSAELTVCISRGPPEPPHLAQETTARMLHCSVEKTEVPLRPSWYQAPAMRNHRGYQRPSAGPCSQCWAGWSWTRWPGTGHEPQQVVGNRDSG
jgi:hypothetical protein